MSLYRWRNDEGSQTSSPLNPTLQPHLTYPTLERSYPSPSTHTKNPQPHLIKLFIYSTFVEPCCFSDKTGEKAWGINVLKKNPKSNRAVPYLYYRSEKHIPPPLYPLPPTYPKLLLLKYLGCFFKNGLTSWIFSCQALFCQVYFLNTKVQFFCFEKLNIQSLLWKKFILIV